MSSSEVTERVRFDLDIGVASSDLLENTVEPREAIAVATLAQAGY